MKEVIRQKVQETKRQIVVEEVSRIFESEGFHSAKMQEIAKKLGISVGALYKLFDSKEALYYAYIEHQIRNFHNELVESCPGFDDPVVCLERYVQLKFEVFSAKRKAIEDPVVGDPLFFVKMNAQRSDPARPIFDYLAKLFESLGRVRPLKEPNPLKLAYLFNAFTSGYIEYWIHYEERLEDSARQVVEEFLYGMAERKEAR